ncbi:MAG: hypothetical protein AB7O32_00675 [Vicinamibacterales bacterium]
MFDDLEAQFFENVLPAYTAFAESLKSESAGMNADLRLGKDAALALFHLREHVPWARGKPWPAFLADCGEFVLLQDIVNVLKHGARRDGQVAKPTDIYETTVITDYEDAEGTYYHAEKEVTVQLRDGSMRNLGAVLKAVLDMWVAAFKARDLLARFETKPPELALIPTRATASGAAATNLRMLQGLRFNWSFRRQKFNYATGRVEPIDLTGHTYEFSIYKPIEVELVMIHNDTGQRLQAVVELSAEETKRYRQLATDEERKALEQELAPKYARQLLRQASQTSGNREK